MESGYEQETAISREAIAEALRAQGGAIAGDAENIARVLHEGDCDTVQSLSETTPQEVVELLGDAGLTNTMKRAGRVVSAFHAIVTRNSAVMFVADLTADLNAFTERKLRERVQGADVPDEEDEEVVMQPGNWKCSDAPIPSPTVVTDTEASADTVTESQHVPLNQAAAMQEQEKRQKSNIAESRVSTELTKLAQASVGRLRETDMLQADITGRPKLKAVLDWAEKCSLSFTVIEPFLMSTLEQLKKLRAWSETNLEVT